jgi:hypothetical protein
MSLFTILSGSVTVAAYAAYASPKAVRKIQIHNMGYWQGFKVKMEGGGTAKLVGKDFVGVEGDFIVSQSYMDESITGVPFHERDNSNQTNNL